MRNYRKTVLGSMQKNKGEQIMDYKNAGVDIEAGYKSD